MVRRRRRKAGNVEEVELLPMNVAGVELQRQQSESAVEDVESNYMPLGRGQSKGNTEEESTYLRPANCTQRFADMSSDDGYARPYEDGPCFTVETELDVGTPLLGRRRASLADRPLPALPSGSRNSLDSSPPIPTPLVRIDTHSNNHLLLPATNCDSDDADGSDVSETGYTDPDGPLSSLTSSKPAYYNTGIVAPIHLNGETPINQSNGPLPCTKEWYETYEWEQVDENPSNTDEEIYDFPPTGHQVFSSLLQFLVF